MIRQAKAGDQEEEEEEEMLLMMSCAVRSDSHYTLSHLVAMEQAEAGVHDGIRRVVVP